MRPPIAFPPPSSRSVLYLAATTWLVGAYGLGVWFPAIQPGERVSLLACDAPLDILVASATDDLLAVVEAHEPDLLLVSGGGDTLGSLRSHYGSGSVGVAGLHLFSRQPLTLAGGASDGALEAVLPDGTHVLAVSAEGLPLDDAVRRLGDVQSSVIALSAVRVGEEAAWTDFQRAAGLSDPWSSLASFAGGPTASFADLPLERVLWRGAYELGGFLAGPDLDAHPSVIARLCPTDG